MPTTPIDLVCEDTFSVAENTLSFGGREIANAVNQAQCADACRQVARLPLTHSLVRRVHVAVKEA